MKILPTERGMKDSMDATSIRTYIPRNTITPLTLSGVNITA